MLDMTKLVMLHMAVRGNQNNMLRMGDTVDKDNTATNVCQR